MVEPNRAISTYSFLAILVAGAFARGSYLLGFPVGIAYLVVAAGLVYLVQRPSSKMVVRKSRWTLVVALAAAMMFPTFVSSDVKFSVEQRAAERYMRAEVRAILKSDPRFAELRVTSDRSKVVMVTVSGSTRSKAVFDVLDNRLRSIRPHYSPSILIWRVTDRATGMSLEGNAS
jgi:hypothetical protein